MSVKCSKCNRNEYRIVIFEVLKQNEKLDILLPICEKCVVKLKRGVK